jgi:uncharacterized protein YcgL (UPF0745 family)
VKCVVYKGSRKPDAYLYIQREGDFSQVPESLLDLMGPLQLVISLDVTNDSTLAQACVEEVLQQLRNQGFYLQLPPSNTKLPSRHHGH